MPQLTDQDVNYDYTSFVTEEEKEERKIKLIVSIVFYISIPLQLLILPVQVLFYLLDRYCDMEGLYRISYFGLTVIAILIGWVSLMLKLFS